MVFGRFQHISEYVIVQVLSPSVKDANNSLLLRLYRKTSSARERTATSSPTSRPSSLLEPEESLLLTLPFVQPFLRRPFRRLLTISLVFFFGLQTPADVVKTRRSSSRSRSLTRRVENLSADDLSFPFLALVRYSTNGSQSWIYPLQGSVQRFLGHHQGGGSQGLVQGRSAEDDQEFTSVRSALSSFLLLST